MYGKHDVSTACFGAGFYVIAAAARPEAGGTDPRTLNHNLTLRETSEKV